MPKPIPMIALVGRPNVGKSTLFNRLTGSRRALVDDRPGVTRDRIFGHVDMDGRRLQVVDTGGFEIYAAVKDDPVMSRMRDQAQLAIDEADFIILVVDAVVGVQPADREVAQRLRQSGKPLAVAANKMDVPAHESQYLPEIYELGLDPVFPISAEHDRGVGELVDYAMGQLQAPAIPEDDASTAVPVSDEELGEDETSRVEWGGGPINVAVIGRPNAGKSSLINCLLGEERLLATEVAGTTRDAVDTYFTHDTGQQFVFIDTAGIRRKRSIADRLERFAVMAAMRTIERADIAVLVLDGTQRISDQDARIASLAHDDGKGLVIVANKWDLIENPEWKERFPDAVRHDLRFVSYAPLLRVSAKTGKNVHALFDQLIAVQRERHRRVGTAELNRFFRAVVETRPPSPYKGKRAKLYFASQPLVRPPTFIFTAARPGNIPTTYARYLRNALRDRYGFEGTPIWLKFRPRGKTARGTHKGGQPTKLTT